MTYCHIKGTFAKPSVVDVSATLVMITVLIVLNTLSVLCQLLIICTQ